MFKDYQTFSACHSGIEAIDFFLAKELAVTLGYPENKLLFYSIVAVSSAIRVGHTCLEIRRWSDSNPWSEDLPFKEGCRLPRFEEWDSYLTSLNLTPDHERPLVYHNYRLYLRRYWQFEHQLSYIISTLQNKPVQIDVARAINVMDRLFTPGLEIDWQKIAVTNTLLSKFSIIAGGPGTGKTTTVTKLLAALIEIEEEPLEIKMAAPTGKAAQRLVESIVKAKNKLAKSGSLSSGTLNLIPEKACTLHRLLGIRRFQTQFQNNKDKSLKLDLLVVDEVSMVDLPLMARLFCALPSHARVVLLGDADQLPSVASGSILADLAPFPHPGFSVRRARKIKQLSGYQVPVSKEGAADNLTFLDKSYRFNHEGGISKLAKQVIRGEVIESWNQLEKGNRELTLITETSFHSWIEKQARQHYKDISTSSCVETAFLVLNKFRILSATRVGPRGVEEINKTIIDILRPDKWRRKSGFYHGCPIMVTKNHPASKLFNGDVGLVWQHSGKLQAAFMDTNDDVRWISLSRLPQVETVYAMTIHKTQGSEMNSVALVLPEKSSPLLTRELIYTAITRARKKIEILCNYEVWKQGVSKKVDRFSGLNDKLNFK